MSSDQLDGANPGRAAAADVPPSPEPLWLADRLSDRDWQIIEIVNRLRLVSGNQLERLVFTSLTGHARQVVRGRVLHRLVSWQVLAALPRRIGGVSRGSSGMVYALGTAGARLQRERQTASGKQPRVRHPSLPTERTLRHTLAVSELYVQLVEQTRAVGAAVVTFQAEPAAWWPNGLGGYLKPDAYSVLAAGEVREHWWVEVDLATESLPTLRRKLLTYLDFVARGQRGPSDVIPRVLVTAVASGRTAAIQQLITHLPDPAAALFVVRLARDAPSYLLSSLQE